jgi:hypothetical protein
VGPTIKNSPKRMLRLILLKNVSEPVPRGDIIVVLVVRVRVREGQS